MVWSLRQGFEKLEIFENDEKQDERTLPFLSRKTRIPHHFSTKDELEEWLRSEEKKQAKNAALRYLAMRNYPSQLLSRKLLGKGFSMAAVQLAVDWAIQMGYVQDQEYLRHQILQEIERGHGPQAILWKLRAKGLEPDLILQMLQELYPIDSQFERIRKLMKRLSDDRQKMTAALFRRGFSLDVIRAALRDSD